MRKSKRGTALFDLLAESDPGTSEGLQAPPGMGLRGQVARAPEVKSPTAGSVEQATTLAPLQPGSPRGSAVELEGERIRLTLTSWTAAIVAFVGIALIVGTFEIGRRFGNAAGFDRGHVAGRDAYLADTFDEIETARQQPPSTDLISSLLLVPEAEPERVVPDRAAPRTERPAETSAARPGSSGTRRATRPETVPKQRAAKSRANWIRDYTYIVAQEFSVGHDEDARRAQDFLADNGVRTELVRYPSGSIQLITLQGYNRDDSTQKRMSQKLLDKVHSIGRNYFSQGGGYRLEGYFKKLKGESW